MWKRIVVNPIKNKSRRKKGQKRTVHQDSKGPVREDNDSKGTHFRSNVIIIGRSLLKNRETTNTNSLRR